jgi:HK97 family phage prohead protease
MQKDQNDVMEIKHAVVPFIKEEGDVSNDTGSFSGYGSVFNNIDLGGDIVLGGAFTKSLQGWKEKGELPAMYGFHNSNNPIGDWLMMEEDSKGLRVKGELWVKGNKRIEQAVVAHNIMKGTGPKGLSIGYYAKEWEDIEFNGGMVRQLKEIELLEVSVVGFAMNPKAQVEAVKSSKLLTKRDIERILRDAGLSKSKAKAFIATGYKALEQDAKSELDSEGCDGSLDLTGVLERLQNLTNRIS